MGWAKRRDDPCSEDFVFRGEMCPLKFECKLKIGRDRGLK